MADTVKVMCAFPSTHVLSNTHLQVDKLQAYAIAKGHAHRDGPTPELKSTLEALCADPKNYVFVVSGREVPSLTQFFGSFQGLGLGAEHGFYYRWPKDDFHSDSGGLFVLFNRIRYSVLIFAG